MRLSFLTAKVQWVIVILSCKESFILNSLIDNVKLSLISVIRTGPVMAKLATLTGFWHPASPNRHPGLEMTVVKPTFFHLTGWFRIEPASSVLHHTLWL